MLQRSVRHLAPLIEIIAATPPEVQDLDLDGYDTDGIDLVHRTALDVGARSARSKRPTYWFTKVMLGVFGCVPAFDTYFKQGFGVSP